VEQIGLGYGTSDGKTVAYGSAREHVKGRFIRLIGTTHRHLEEKNGWTMITSVLIVTTDEFGEETYKWDWPGGIEAPVVLDKYGQPLDKVDEKIQVIRKKKEEDDMTST
jgi:hypothetical protein